MGHSWFDVIKKILIALGIISIGLILFLVLGPLRKRIPQSVSNLAGPSCPSGSVFTVPPVAPGDFISVTPLGNLNPPDHTIPTDHIYIVIKQNNNIDPAAAKIVRAPGDITITRVSHDVAKKQGAVFSDDYAIDFTPCKEVRINFGHVNTISDELKAAFEQARPSCDSHVPQQGDEYTYCVTDMSYPVKAGVALGTAGGGTATGLDIQAVDKRSPKLTYANPKRYRSDAFYFVCPLDLFETQVKESLYAKLGNGMVNRTIEPLCGQVAQDVPGTAQGNWITGGGDLDSPETWSKTIALVHDNFDPAIGIASIGGAIGDAQQIAFRPKRSGAINREFSEVKPDGNIYCYFSDANSGSGFSNASNRLLIELTSETSLKAEVQTDSCSDSVLFSKPTTYER